MDPSGLDSSQSQPKNEKHENAETKLVTKWLLNRVAGLFAYVAYKEFVLWRLWRLFLSVNRRRHSWDNE